MQKLENTFEKLLFQSRWLLAPFFTGLLFCLILLLIKFTEEFFHIVPHIFTISENELIIAILSLIDITLIASLIVIITLSGYESFVSKIDVDQHEDKPGWMGKLGFSELKIKVIGSIVAISAIDLLRVFLNIESYSESDLFWKVIIHLTFVVSGLLFAAMDRIAHN